MPSKETTEPFLWYDIDVMVVFCRATFERNVLHLSARGSWVSASGSWASTGRQIVVDAARAESSVSELHNIATGC